MKAIIDRLKTLNELDVQLRMIKKDMERLPKELSVREQQARDLKTVIDRSKADILKMKVQADAVELEVKSGEEVLKRYANQMNTMRSPKEFDAVRRQMDAQRAWNRENEGKALEILEQVDAKQKDVEKNAATLAAAEAVLAEDTARIQKEVTELKLQYDGISVEREKLAVDVPEKDLVVYNRVVHTHGSAIASVNRGICSACFMKIPPQYHNLALLAKELVCCPSCGRILTAG